MDTIVHIIYSNSFLELYQNKKSETKNIDCYRLFVYTSWER